MLSDKDAINKVRDGEIDYFSAIVEKYTKSIYMYIYSRLNKKEDSEDLVQNVFISFYKSINRFDIDKPVKPYLYQIVQNELKMFYRKNKPTLPLKEDIAIEEKDSLVVDKSSLDSLNYLEKKLILMISEGYSYEEVAEKFKKSINTVKSIVRRARIKLKKYEKT